MSETPDFRNEATKPTKQTERSFFKIQKKTQVFFVPSVPSVASFLRFGVSVPLRYLNLGCLYLPTSSSMIHPAPCTSRAIVRANRMSVVSARPALSL
jgi:hypothetical protein